MPSPTLARWTAVFFALGGVSIALWPLVHPWAHLAGVHVGQSGAWTLSHSFHFFAGFFLAFALLGLAMQRAESTGLAGAAAFILAFSGTTLFAGTGMFTAWLWPVLAVYAPLLTEVDGPFFSPPHPLIGITSLLFSAGYIALAIGLIRAGVLSRWGGVTLSIGALLLAIPPAPITPTPWSLFVLAGLLTGAGFLSLSRTLWSAGARVRLRGSRSPAADHLPQREGAGR